MLYDTHAHVYSEEYGDDAARIIQDSLAKGVWINNIGTGKATSLQALEAAREFSEGVYASVGMHPTDVSEEFDLEFFETLARDQKVVAIGECGLDYYRLKAEEFSIERSRQIEVFKKQIGLAAKIGKVLVIHTRASAGSIDAYEDSLEILQEFSSNKNLPKFVVHSFTDSWEVCDRFISLGGFIALNGIITFDKSGKLLEVIQKIPLERLLLETDAPYLAPVPYRGQQNLPEYVAEVAKFVAKKRGKSLEEISEITFNNARKVFNV